MNPIEIHVSTLIIKAIRRSKKSRNTVAAELSVAVGKNVTESMLYEFTRSRREDKNTKKLFPSEWIPCLAAITGSHELEQYALCEECRRALTIGKVGTSAMSQELGEAMNSLFPETELDQKVDALKCDPAKKDFHPSPSAHGRTGNQLQLQSPRLR